MPAVAEKKPMPWVDMMDAWQQQSDEIVALLSSYPDMLQLHGIQAPGLSTAKVEAVLSGEEEFDALELDDPENVSSDQALDISIDMQLIVRPEPVEGAGLVILPSKLPSSSHKTNTSHTFPSPTATRNEPPVNKDPVSASDQSSKPAASRITNVPPIRLTVRTTKYYPHTTPPDIELMASWLTDKQLVSISDVLWLLWEDQGPDCPILFTWADWLTHSVLNHLGISDNLPITPDTGATALILSTQVMSQDNAPSSSTASAVHPRWQETVHHEYTASDEAAQSLERTYRHLLQYNVAERKRRFADEIVTCPICFDERLGKQCAVLECQHHFCLECLGQQCSLGVRDNQLVALRCPDPSCKQSLSPSILQEVLSEVDFARWEDMCLAQSLNGMEDVVYCPRCSAPCIEEGDLAQCARCLFAFCAMCFDSWHPGTQCSDAASKLAILVARGQRVSNRHLTIAQQAEEQRVSALRMEELKNEAAVRKISKACPTCRAAIAKAEGCNKVLCALCGNFMCWRCGIAIKDYTHYENCVLFEEDQVTNWDAQWRAMMEIENGNNGGEQERRPRRDEMPARCPACGQDNAKHARNNHIRCWSCLQEFCAACEFRLRGRGAAPKHFGPSGCKQHS